MATITKHREARDSFSEDFTARLTNGETLTSAEVFVRSSTGTVDYSADMVGTVTVASTGLVTYLLLATAVATVQLPGRYAVEVRAVTSTGRVLVATSDLVVTGDRALHTLLVDHITITPAGPYSVQVGAALQLTATPYDANGNALTGLTATWSSSDRTLATVDDAGKVAGLAFGTPTLSVVIGGVTQTIALTVSLKATQLVAQETVVALVVGHARNGAYTPKDANGNATTDPVTYASNNAAVATVDANGQITPVAPGGPVTITATCGTVTQARTLTCYADLTPTVAWEPFAQGNWWPRVRPSTGPGWAGEGYEAGAINRWEPSAVDRWVSETAPGGITGGDPGGNSGSNSASYVNLTGVALPSPSLSQPIRVTFSATPAWICFGVNYNNSPAKSDPWQSRQRGGSGYLARATTAADIGKTFDLWLCTDPGNVNATVIAKKTFTLQSNVNWQYAYVDMDEVLQSGQIVACAVHTGTTGTPATTVDLLQGSIRSTGKDATLNGGWITPWGLPAEMISCNAWGPDSDYPTLHNPSGQSHSAVTADHTPDSDQWIGGNFFVRYWIANGDGWQTPGLCYAASQPGDGSGSPSPGAWVMMYVEPNTHGDMPADGDFQATFTPAGGSALPAFNFVRDPVQLRRPADGASFYRARIPLNLGAPTVVVSSTGGTLANTNYYYKVAPMFGTAEGIPSAESTASVLTATGSVALSWSAVPGATSYRIYRGTASNGENVYYTSTTNSFTDTGAASTAGSPSRSACTQGTVTITNATGNLVEIVATRFAVVPEDSRTAGWHQSIVPRRNLRVQPPGAPVIAASTTGGTLAAGAYRYVVTAFDSNLGYNRESLPSAEASVTNSGTTSSNALSWAKSPSDSQDAIVQKYRVYRTAVNGAAGSENVYWDVGTATTWTDTGAAGTAGTPPTQAPFQIQDLAWMKCDDVRQLFSVDQGIMAIRVVLPYTLADCAAMGIFGMPGFWQSGPLGSSLRNFDFSVTVQGGGQTFDIVMNGQPTGGDNWGITIPIANGSGTFPAWTAFDVLVAWQNRQPVAFGIGYGAGDYQITWLNNGDLFQGQTVSIGYTAGTAWEYQSGDLFGFGDRDRTRVSGGWYQGILTCAAVPATPTEAKAVLEEHVRYRWGTRPSY